MKLAKPKVTQRLAVKPGAAKRAPEIRERLGIDKTTWRRAVDIVEAGPWRAQDREPVVLMLKPPQIGEPVDSTNAAVVIRKFARALRDVWDRGESLIVFEVVREPDGLVEPGALTEWSRTVQ